MTRLTLFQVIVFLSSFKVHDSQPISFPSLLSHMTSMFLNHKVLALPVLPKKRGVPPLQTFSPLSGTMPCDFHLLNLRSIQNKVCFSLGPGEEQ